MNFREWNDAIAKELFNETKEGERVFLFCTQDFLNDVANKNESSVEDFLNTVRQGPEGYENLSFLQQAKRINQAWKNNRDSYEYPPFIIFMAFLIYAEVAEEGNAPVSYWDKPIKLLAGNELGSPPSRKVVEELFDELELWSIENDEKYGWFKAYRQGQLRIVGLIIGQVFFTQNDLQNLPEIFCKAQFNPEFPPPEVELIDETRIKGDRLLNARTKRILRECTVSTNKFLKEIVVEVLQEALAGWDGYAVLDQVTNPPSSTLVLSAEYNIKNRNLKLSLRTKSVVEINEEGMEITNTTNPNHETYLVENLRNGYSKKIRSNSTQSDFEPDLKGDESKEIFQDDKSYKFVLHHKKVKILVNMLENINGFTEVSAIPENRGFHILIKNDLSEALLNCENEFKNGLKKIEFNHSQSDNWILYKTDGLKSDLKTKAIHPSLSFISQPRPKWIGGLRALGRNDFHVFARPVLFLPDNENISQNLVFIKTSDGYKPLIETKDGNVFKLPEDLIKDEKLDVVILSQSGDQIGETLTSIKLVENPNWPPLEQKRIYLNSAGEKANLETESCINGPEVSQDLIDYSFNPTMVSSLFKLEKAKLLGNSPEKFIEHNSKARKHEKDPLDPDWSPVWAVIPIGKKRYEVIFLQESVAHFNPQPTQDLEKKDLNKKIGKYPLKNRIKRWKDALNHKQKFSLKENSPEIQNLWNEYINYAESV